MSNNSVTSNIILTAYEKRLLAGWSAYGEFPAAATKTVTVALHIGGIVANTTLIIYLIHSKRCRLVVFALLTSLAMCDWLMSVTLINTVLFIMPNLAFVRRANQVCWVNVYLNGISYTSGICHVMALAVLRFYQLVYPLRAKACVTTGRVAKCCLGMWLFCAAVATQYPINYTVTPVPYNNKTLLICHFVGNEEAKEVFITVFAQGIPLIVIALLHLIKLFKVTKASQISKSERRSSSSKIVVLLIMCFVISILPKFSHMCYHTVLGYPYHVIHASWTLYAGIIAATNSAVNPFLYLLSSKEIRRDIYKMMQCKAMKKI